MTLFPSEKVTHWLQVYREWTLNREPLLTERPKRARVTAESAPFLLLPSPGSGPWPPEILEMLESRTELPQGESLLLELPQQHAHLKNYSHRLLLKADG